MDRETMQGRIEMALTDLDDRIEYDGGAESFFRGDWQDTVHEIADSCVPVYTNDLLDIAATDNRVGVDEPELGPAFDGSPTPTNIIAANIYERLTEALYERANELEQAVAA